MTAILVCACLWGQADPASSAPPNSASGEPSAETVHAFLLEHDIDKDGMLTPAELPERYRKSFLRGDLNGDGKLDARELLNSRSLLGRDARRAEGLKMTRRGLERKTGFLRPNEEIEFRVQSTLLQRLDRNRDGFADAQELGTLPQEQGILFGDRPNSMTLADAQALAQTNTQLPPATPTPATDQILSEAPRLAQRTTPGLPSPFDPQLIPSQPALPPRPDAAEPIAEFSQQPMTPGFESLPVDPGPPTPPPTNATAGAGANLPSAEAILENLDKNGNGQLDRDEAVDQLADNFPRLDRNRDNMLSLQEIKRGLFLARMLGIKPKQDPRTYQSKP